MACRYLGSVAEEAALVIEPISGRARLASLGFASREQIAERIKIFSHGNCPHASLQTQARMLLEQYALPSDADATPYTDRHGLHASVPWVLMELHHADGDTHATS